VELLVATRSADKMTEIRRILAEVPGLVVIDLDAAGIPEADEEEHLEPHDTFEENARSKAEYFFATSGIATVADDSGLEVDALGGGPGVRSKRFAPDQGLSGKALDQANNHHLMERLRDVRAGARTGRYVCAAVLVGLNEGPISVRGEAGGVILSEPQGSGGFGYDPYFFDSQLGRTFAQLSAEEKNARSHRGEAFRALARRLKQRNA